MENVELNNNLKRKFIITCFIKKIYDFYEKFQKLSDYQLFSLSKGWYCIEYRYLDQITKDLLYVKPDLNFEDLRYYYNKERCCFVIY